MNAVWLPFVGTNLTKLLQPVERVTTTTCPGKPLIDWLIDLLTTCPGKSHTHPHYEAIAANCLRNERPLLYPQPVQESVNRNHVGKSHRKNQSINRKQSNVNCRCSGLQPSPWPCQTLHQPVWRRTWLWTRHRFVWTNILSIDVQLWAWCSKLTARGLGLHALTLERNVCVRSGLLHI